MATRMTVARTSPATISGESEVFFREAILLLGYLPVRYVFIADAGAVVAEAGVPHHGSGVFWVDDVIAVCFANAFPVILGRSFAMVEVFCVWGVHGLAAEGHDGFVEVLADFAVGDEGGYAAAFEHSPLAFAAFFDGEVFANAGFSGG